LTVPSHGWTPPPPPAPPNKTTSALLIAKTYAMVVADPTMVGLVALSALASGLAFASIAVPAWLFGHITVDDVSPTAPGFVLYAAAAWASAFVGILGSGTVVAAGLASLDGRSLTVREAFGVAWSRRRQLVAWALVATLFSLLERVFERFGLAGLILRLATDVAWALATLLVLPVILDQGAMPMEAVKVSARLVKERLGLTARTAVRFYLPWVIVTIVSLMVTVAGVFAFVHYRNDVPSWSAAGLIVAVLGALGVFGAIAVQTAAGAFLDTILYRHAMGLPVPGVDSHHLPAVSAPRWPSPPVTG
jgi:Family of unknown function (DUF6159)